MAWEQYNKRNGRYIDDGFLVESMVLNVLDYTSLQQLLAINLSNILKTHIQIIRFLNIICL